MKVIALCGSPRNGNTEFYLTQVLGHLKAQGHETSLILLKDKKIEQCTGCYQCIENKACVVQDDFQAVFQEMIEADCIVAGSPVYNGSITPRLKAVLDRAGFSARWMKNELNTTDKKYNWGQMIFSRKLFAPITVARKTGQTFAWSQLALWAGVNDLILVGSNYWTVGTAGTSGKMNADEDTEGASIMKHLSDNLHFLLTKIHQ
ncbi:flavodoxin family protein [Anoxynatronum sibiricum]|uniref:Flavodoxin family protein n=1 Tax=Anoxynatronum sibiricum TaxID=210623 RepID=A0ABU9VQZ6_9CLOT